MKDKNVRNRLLESLWEIDLTVNKNIINILTGVHISTLKGRGLEFEGFKEFKPGDDPRHIDWRMTLKLSKIIVKKYRQEKRARIGLYLDLSRSMEFGSGEFSKKDLGIFAAGAIGYSAFLLDDEIDLIGFSGNGAEKESFSISNKDFFVEDLLRLKELEIKTKKKQSGFSAIFDDIFGYQGDVVFIISDFITEIDKNFIQLFEKTLVEHEIVPILISDTREHKLPSVGLVDLKDPETNEIITLDCSDKKKREEFEEIAKMRIDEFGRAMNQAGILWADISSSDNWIENLIKLFLQKKSLLRRF